MTIDVNDWPIDPYVVDGVELATRLNKVIPSEFNSLINGKANLTGGNTWSGNQSYTGSLNFRFIADFSASAHTSRAGFQTSYPNSNTNVGAMPSGSAGGSSFIAYGTGDPTNAYYSKMFCANGGVCGLDVGTQGSYAGTYQTLGLQQNGRTGFQLAPNGASYVINTIGSNHGYLMLQSTDGSKIRQMTVDSSNNMMFLNNAGTAVQRFHNDGTMWSSYYIDIQGNAANVMRLNRNSDGTNHNCMIQDIITGQSVSLAYLSAVGETFTMMADGGAYLGWSLARWAAVYAINGTIQTSDAREKTPLREFNDAEIKVAEELADKIGFFKWLYEIDQKGEEAKWRVGTIAQDVDDIFTAHGLSSQDYGVILYEVFEEQAEFRNPDTGEIITEYRPWTDRWSADYAQLNQFVCKGLREKQKRIEARLDALEAK